MEEKPEENIAVGSCRSIENFNITKALSSVSHLLENLVDMLMSQDLLLN